MLFNSLQYLIFFPIVATTFFFTPHRYRWLLLLCASYYFYISWKAEYALLLLGTTTITYMAAIAISHSSSKTIQQILLTVSLLTNFSVLIFFKYLTFFNKILDTLLLLIQVPYEIRAPNVLLPIGISFYLFRTTSYLIDVYRNDLKPEKHFGIFSLYVSFFPSLLAGPIDRATRLLPQFHQKLRFDKSSIWTGLQLILLGFFKKVVIADRLSIYVDNVFNNITYHKGFGCLLASFFYTIQIYCDFSGYSDIAIGCAAIMGFRLMTNFNNPYFATTIPDFWRRWHISLSTWFRDYVYIPLGGSRKGLPRTLANFMITMLLCGLWHGASWTFVFWGGAHGLLLCLSKLTLSWRDRLSQQFALPSCLKTTVRIIVTFNVVNLLWVFFRASSIQDAFSIIYNMLQTFNTKPLNLDRIIALPNFLLICGFVLILLIYEKFVLEGSSFLRNRYIKMIFFSFIFWSIIIFGSFSNQAFIYFQF